MVSVFKEHCYRWWMTTVVGVRRSISRTLLSQFLVSGTNHLQGTVSIAAEPWSWVVQCHVVIVLCLISMLAGRGFLWSASTELAAGENFQFLHLSDHIFLIEISICIVLGGGTEADLPVVEYHAKGTKRATPPPKPKKPTFFPDFFFQGFFLCRQISYHRGGVMQTTNKKTPALNCI